MPLATAARIAQQTGGVLCKKTQRSQSRSPAEPGGCCLCSTKQALLAAPAPAATGRLGGGAVHRSMPCTERGPALRLRAASAEHQDQAAAGASGRNILVAVDSSEDSRYALQWTVQEVYCPGDTIHVAHCIPYLPVAGGVYALQDGRLAMVNLDLVLSGGEEQYLRAEQAAVERTCADTFRELQVDHMVHVLRDEALGRGDTGRIAGALCRKAEELQAAAVVIASHAKSGLSEFVLGSVADHCTQHCTRPVLVLHAPRGGQQQGRQQHPGLLDRLASAAAAALGGGEQAERAEQQRQQQQPATAAGQVGEGFSGGRCSLRRNIVLAVDDSEASERACSWALGNLYRPGDTFHLLRIIPTMPYRASYGGPVLDGMVFYMDPPTEDFKAAAQHFVQHRFEPRLREAGVAYEVDVIVEATDESVQGVGQAICQRAEEMQAAAVVLGSHMSGGLVQFMLGSVANYVAHNCRRPVAVLH